MPIVDRGTEDCSLPREIQSRLSINCCTTSTKADVLTRGIMSHNHLSAIRILKNTYMLGFVLIRLSWNHLA